MVDVIGQTVNLVKDSTTDSGSWFSGNGLLVGVTFIIIVLVVAAVVAFVWFFFFEAKKWNIVVRVHYENPTINGVTIGSPIMAKRVRFKDGRVVYVYKTPIQGYTISPELLVWTRPKEHDVVITQDKKIFCVLGINSIDVQRRMLNVDLSYPDIEMDRQDLQHFVDSKSYDDPNDKLKIIAKTILWIFVFVTIIILAVLGGKAYVEGKNIQLEQDKVMLQNSAQSAEVMKGVNTMTALLTNLMPELIKLKGTANVNALLIQNRTI